MAESKSEVLLWLEKISNGLNLERFSVDFEARGFITKASLKYLDKTDIEQFFQSPRKLLFAEKRIIEKELEVLKKGNLQPKTLFPDNDGIINDCGIIQIFGDNLGNVAHRESVSAVSLPGPVDSTNIPTTTPSFHDPQAQGNKGNYLDKRQQDLTEDLTFLQTRLQSAKQEYQRRNEEMNTYDQLKSKRSKVCSRCHNEGHNISKCKRPPCESVSLCNLKDKHPELKAELGELQKLIKDIEKKSEKGKSDLDTFVSARNRAASTFFAIMRPRLKKQNPAKYVSDRSALDRDLLILKRTLGNKVPVSENDDWRLQYLIESYQRSHIEPYRGQLSS